MCEEPDPSAVIDLRPQFATDTPGEFRARENGTGFIYFFGRKAGSGGLVVNSPGAGEVGTWEIN